MSSFFGVTMESIDEIFTHPDAHSLEIATVRGMSFQFVVLKGKYKHGDKVLYFPIDSIIPEEHLVKMGLSGKLSGSKSNRVKSREIRGVVSQGVVEFVETLLPADMIANSPSTQDITSFLGVYKYEEPVVTTPDGTLRHLPENCSEYDLESSDRYGYIVEELRKLNRVVIFEKMEGTNFSIKKDADNKIFVNSKRNTIEEEPGKINMYWEAARKSFIMEEICNMPHADVIIYAELCGPGIQKNIYKLKKPQLFVFDMKIDGKWVPFDKMKELFDKYLLRQTMAPVIFIGKLDDFLQGKTFKEMSDGKSVVNPEVDREGLVGKTAEEEIIIPRFGRAAIKQRGPHYLVKTGL